jgi:hypothetical protein
MTNIFMLLGSLIILMMGFVAPLINLLISLYQEGVNKLNSEFEKDKNSVEVTLGEKLKVKSVTSDQNLGEIVETVSQIKKIKKTAGVRLSYFESKTVFKKLFLPLLGAFIVDLGSFLTSNLKVEVSCLAFIFVVLLIVALEFFQFLQVLHKVKASADEKANGALQRICELLENLNQKYSKVDESLAQLPKTKSPLLEKVYVRFSEIDITKDTNVKDIKVNEKATYSVAITNDEDRMAKNVQAGFIVPGEFVLDKSGPDSIYLDDDTKEQVARFNLDMIHSDTYFLKESLTLTPTKKGKFNVRVFIKGENVMTRYLNLKFTVV